MDLKRKSPAIKPVLDVTRERIGTLLEGVFPGVRRPELPRNCAQKCGTLCRAKGQRRSRLGHSLHPILGAEALWPRIHILGVRGTRIAL